MLRRKEKICRLCLKSICGTNYEEIEEIRNDMLEVLLIHMDFSVNDKPVMCSSCLKTLENCFNFKSTCFYVEDYIIPFVKQDVKVDLSEVFREKMKISEEIKLEDHKMCRLCMALIENNTYKSITEAENEIWITDMKKKYLPELDLTYTYDPLICDICLCNLQDYSEFMKTCLDTEQEIIEYLKKNGTIGNDQLDLCKVLQFREELTQSNNEDDSKDDESRSQMIAKRVKEQSHLSEQDTNSDSPVNVNVMNKSNSNGRHSNYSCTKCSFQVNCPSNFEAHLLRYHHNPPIFMCDLCHYKTGNRLKLNSHFSEHSSATKRFGCKKCKYETNYKGPYKLHILRHKNPAELPTYKCNLCSFQTKRPGGISSHKKFHHNDKITYLKCNNCDFETKHKNSMRIHELLHKKPEDIPMHQCPHCEFKTKTKQYLSQHLFRHKDPEKSEQFKCSKCPYKSLKRRNLKWHLLTHMDFDEVKMHSCDICTYSTKHRENLARHKKIHQNSEERKLYKCTLCDYAAKTKISVTRHMPCHIDPSEGIKYKCDVCSYQTNSSHLLYNHKKKHETEHKLETFKCMHCLYETKFKSYLACHLQVHAKPDRVKMLKCNQCSFKTYRADGLRSHVRIHNPKCSPKFKCTLCDYKTINKGNLTYHRLTHLEMDETTIFKCATCKFETKYKGNLKSHAKICKGKKCSK